MINCMNVCLGNQLLAEIDKYAEIMDLRRDEVIQHFIDTIKSECDEYEQRPKTPWITFSSTQCTFSILSAPPRFVANGDEVIGER